MSGPYRTADEPEAAGETRLRRLGDGAWLLQIQGQTEQWNCKNLHEVNDVLERFDLQVVSWGRMT